MLTYLVAVKLITHDIINLNRKLTQQTGVETVNNTHLADKIHIFLVVGLVRKIVHDKL